MVKITEETEAFANKVFPGLKEDLRMAQMNTSVGTFVNKCLLFAGIMAFSLSLIFFIVLIQRGLVLFTIPIFAFFFIIMFTLCMSIPKLNINKVRQEIESDIFTPARMMLTLLESGNSLISALEGVSYTKAKSSKYFGKIASEIYLGKNIEQAIEDAIRYTPSDSFRMVLEPIKKSLKTGTDIQVNMQATLQQLSEQKIVEIEQYEKRLNPLSMFYMIFGTVLPAIGMVGIVLILSVIGFKIEFFPVFFILLILIILLQLFFVKLFQSTRPMVKL